MAFILTRIQVGDYDMWKALFDQDGPAAPRRGRASRVPQPRRPERGVHPDRVPSVGDARSSGALARIRRARPVRRQDGPHGRRGRGIDHAHCDLSRALG